MCGRRRKGHSVSNLTPPNSCFHPSPHLHPIPSHRRLPSSTPPATDALRGKVNVSVCVYVLCPVFQGEKKHEAIDLRFPAGDPAVLASLSRHTRSSVHHSPFTIHLSTRSPIQYSHRTTPPSPPLFPSLSSRPVECTITTISCKNRVLRWSRRRARRASRSSSPHVPAIIKPGFSRRVSQRLLTQRHPSSSTILILDSVLTSSCRRPRRRRPRRRQRPQVPAEEVVVVVEIPALHCSSSLLWALASSSRTSGTMRLQLYANCHC